MPKGKEDRSDWVAVAPQFAAAAPEIPKAKTAYQFFQGERGEALKAQVLREHGGTFVLAAYTRLSRQVWKDLTDDERVHFDERAAADSLRYAKASHAADVAALERTQRLQAERDQTLVLEDHAGPQRTTRRALEKKHRKQAKKEARKLKSKGGDDDDDDDANDDWNSDVLDSEDSDDSEAAAKRKKAAAAPKRVVSQEQKEALALKQAVKAQHETYLQGRQQDLRKEKAAQAKKRLEFLLSQSDIFKHFGNVKEESAKYGITTASATSTKSTTAVGRREAMSADDADNLEEADEHDATFLTQQPTTLGFGKMRPYQLEGLNWMIRLQEHGVNGILADEMGLGKTLQSISVLVYMLEYRNDTGPHLIVVPKSTLSNWMNEIARWAPNLKAVIFHGDKAAREEIARTRLGPAQKDSERDWHVVVTTYEICNIEKSVLNKLTWGYLIIDEAHRLKNEASAFSRTIRLFETKYRLLLTGTPLQNSLHELWALLNFLVPDVFESSEQFDEWFNLDIEDKEEKNKLISQLHKILRPFMLRRLKADVEKSLPAKHETILFTGMSTMQKQLYRDILMRDLDALQGASGSRTAILNIVMQLRKCAGHPYLFPGVEDRSLPPLGEHLVEHCGKMVLLDKLLRRLKEGGHRVLLFTQMTRILDILEDYLRMRQFSYCRIDGNTSYDDREQFIEDYNKPNSEKFVFLLSTRAGGLGINLQSADIVILYDSDWNPQADLQAQDRAHRIGQKRAVQVFRLVTEHTIEEKIVERAQQKLKLDAMVVQQGRLKDKDKLSRDELLSAVRFGADKIFKSKDSSITDDDIDMILNQGKQKTQELNEKLKTADKGDMLDFKLDGSSVQTFEGVDYSSAFAQARQAEMLGIFDIGKRERKEANYNENTLYQRQVALQSGPKKPKKKKDIRLPKHLRLPKMQEWQMYDRDALVKLSEEEEAAFKALPEEQQKAATVKKSEEGKAEEGAEGSGVSEAADPAVETEGEETEAPAEPFELPPLLSDEQQALKDNLLSEGFSTWNRFEYNAFLRGSARHGRQAYDRIAVDVGKSEDEVRQYAEAFWGDIGQTRIMDTEYERATKSIERGEKKINEVTSLERATRIFVSLFDNPWDELQFTHVNCKDKMFTVEEDRFLLCWARKYGFGQWMAIKMAVRRNPNFRFDYFLRSLPVELLGKRCEQLMKAAEKEIEHFEKQTREALGLPTEAEEGKSLPPVKLPTFRVLQRQLRSGAKAKHETTHQELQGKVNDLEAQINELQARLKEINAGVAAPTPKAIKKAKATPRPSPAPPIVASEVTEAVSVTDSKAGAPGGDGSFVAFPDNYEGSEAPVEWKKPFTQYCVHNRRSVKASLAPEDRRDKKLVNSLLKEQWLGLSDDEKEVYRRWTEWDKKRFAHEEFIFQQRRTELFQQDEGADETVADDGTQDLHVPKKRVSSTGGEEDTVPRKKRKQ